jgi:mono/diheme cytochrome c family protein
VKTQIGTRFARFLSTTMHTFHLRSVRSVALVAVVAMACAHGQQQVPLPVPPAASSDAQSDVARGEYIVRNVAVCGGCHAAEEGKPDGPLSGGHEFRDWRIGTARASNLTPDNATGLGTWTEAEIVRAIRTGVRKDGRLLAPVMPYAWLNGMSDGDAFAVARYLKTLPPVSNPVRQDFNLAFRVGKVFFLRPKPAGSIASPAHAATAEYGGYVSQHVGLCGECHTPRTGIRAEADTSRLFAGTAQQKDFPANPSNLTPDTTGIASWSEADFVQTIRTGVNPHGVHLHPFMPWHQNSRMSDDDLRAIYLFLRTVPPIHNEVPRRGEVSK